MNEYGKPHVIHLDGLRGLAILLVLLRHFTDDTLVEKWFLLGWTGVDLFFVISGFLITGILLDTKTKKNYFKVFISRRALRILPVYYGVIIFCLILSPFLSILHWFNDYQFYFWTYTQNYLIAEKGFFTIPLGHFWSLAIEEQFYLIWPLIILILKPRQVLFIIVILLISGIVIRFYHPSLPFAYVFTPTHLDGLLSGSAIAILMRINKDKLLKFSPYIFFILLAALSIFFAFQKPWESEKISFVRFGYTMIGLFYGSLLLFSFVNRRIQRILSVKTLIMLGKYSYGIYVYHAILINLTKYYFSFYILNYRVITYLILFILSLTVSYLSYHLVEKHFLKMKPSFTHPG